MRRLRTGRRLHHGETGAATGLQVLAVGGLLAAVVLAAMPSEPVAGEVVAALRCHIDAARCEAPSAASPDAATPDVAVPQPPPVVPAAEEPAGLPGLPIGTPSGPAGQELLLASATVPAGLLGDQPALLTQMVAQQVPETPAAAFDEASQRMRSMLDGRGSFLACENDQQCESISPEEWMSRQSSSNGIVGYILAEDGLFVITDAVRNPLDPNDPGLVFVPMPEMISYFGDPGQSATMSAAFNGLDMFLLSSAPWNSTQRGLTALIGGAAAAQRAYYPSALAQAEGVALDPRLRYCNDHGCWGAEQAERDYGGALWGAIANGVAGAPFGCVAKGLPGCLIEGANGFLLTLAPLLAAEDLRWSRDGSTPAPADHPLAQTAVADGQVRVLTANGTIRRQTPTEELLPSVANNCGSGVLSGGLFGPKAAALSCVLNAATLVSYTERTPFILEPMTPEEVERERSRRQEVTDLRRQQLEALERQVGALGGPGQTGLAVSAEEERRMRADLDALRSQNLDRLAYHLPALEFTGYTVEDYVNYARSANLHVLRLMQRERLERSEALLSSPFGERVGLEPGEDEERRVRNDLAALRSQNLEQGLAALTEADQAARRSDGPVGRTILEIVGESPAGPILNVSRGNLVRGPDGQPIVGPFTVGPDGTPLPLRADTSEPFVGSPGPRSDGGAVTPSASGDRSWLLASLAGGAPGQGPSAPASETAGPLVAGGSPAAAGDAPAPATAGDAPAPAAAEPSLPADAPVAVEAGGDPSGGTPAAGSRPSSPTVAVDPPSPLELAGEPYSVTGWTLDGERHTFTIGETQFGFLDGPGALTFDTQPGLDHFGGTGTLDLFDSLDTAEIGFTAGGADLFPTRLGTTTALNFDGPTFGNTTG